jgi:hypothetical protein
MAAGWPAHASGTTLEELQSGFETPPDSAAPRTWWHWMNGNVTREGIKADLEAMHKAGIRSATIVTIGYKTPPGPVKYLSPEWLALVKYAAEEGQKLGITIGMGNCAGWSSTGAPWVKPSESMLTVVSSETDTEGPRHFTDTLPTPRSPRDPGKFASLFAQLGPTGVFYRDLKVVAFPTPDVDQVSMDASSPTITGSDPGFDGTKVNHGLSSLPFARPSHPQYVQVAFTQPFQVRTVSIYLDQEFRGNGRIEASDDGQNFRNLRPVIFRAFSGLQSYEVPAASARFYRIVFNDGSGPNGQVRVSKLNLSPAPRVDDYRGKAMAADRIDGSAFDSEVTPDVPADMAVQPNQAIDLTARMDKDGKLDWNVPPGKWTILRFGYTPTGIANHPAPPEGTGPEIDKLSRSAARAYWDGLLPKLKSSLGPLLGGNFDHVLIDSYEVGVQNWTPAFREEFRRRCGYDVFDYLPVLAGRVVGSPEKSERFLWDFRRVIASLFAENYYDYFEVLAHQAGIKLELEPYGNGPFDELRSGRDADRVMGEFWWPSPSLNSVHLAASVAHTYGKTLAGAESFTSADGGYEMSPPTMKALGDLAYANGINSFTFHRYTHEPWMNRWPGMTMDPWGSNLERTNTWYGISTAWMTYLSRCQYLLQQGLVVNDVLSFEGEDEPATPRDLVLKNGYSGDSCDTDTLLHRLSVKDGRLVLPDGMSYRLLVLPSTKKMTPELLQKLKQLVDGGATILGDKPVASPSLVGYPKCDDEVRQLADELWDGGKIISGKTPDDVLASLGVKPDFQSDASDFPPYLHRVVNGTDLYFVSNQQETNLDSDCVFRVTGKTPELWHPDTGAIEKVAAFSDDGSLTHLHLRLDPVGSVFVVFRPGTPPADHPISLGKTGGPTTPAADTLVINHAVLGDIQNGKTKDVTDMITSKVSKGCLLFLVGAKALPPVSDPGEASLKVDYTLDGQAGSRTIQVAETIDIHQPHFEFPDSTLHLDDKGALQLEAWTSGTYNIALAGGQTISKDVTVPAPVAVGGSWDVSFPPNWGAPPKITLDQLGSLSDNSNPGVKYFSGTATYTKTIPIAAENLGDGHRLYLDLGDVQVMAQVKLNGHDFGTLWKPPYRIDITGVAKPGDNALEVKVTDLWPNRLIGDDLLPPDAEYNSDSSIKAWPQWLLDGKPSPTGRLTFSNWRHWTKNDTVIPAGLIGPVVLRTSTELAIP